MKRIRKNIKQVFDWLVYSYPAVNKVTRNLNKFLSPYINFRVRPSGVFTVRFKSGVTFKLATNETSAVTKRIFWEGADRYEYSALFERLVNKCNVFADVGANLGYYSILGAKVNPTLTVFAFEPANSPSYFLQKNVDINRLKQRVEVVPVALSNTTGHIEFYEVHNSDQKPRHNLGGTGRIAKGSEFTRTVKVPTTTMDLFFKSRSTAPDLIKIDTEGTENLILSGAHSILSKHKPIIICETLFNVIEADLEKIMVSYNYDFYNFKDGTLTKTNTITRSHDDGIRDCFFVHPEREELIQEFLKSDLN